MISALAAFAQNGEITGDVTDTKGLPIEYSQILLKQDGYIVRRYLSPDGSFSFNDIPAGKYSIVIHFGVDSTVKPVSLAPGGTVIEHIHFMSPEQLGTAVIRASVTQVKDEEDIDIKDQPIPNPGTIIAIMPNVTPTRNGFVFSGSRPGGTGISVDGARFIGPLPPVGLGLVGLSTFQSGVPARYGDFTGGLARYSTRVPNMQKRKSFEVYSSSPFNPYHHNRFHSFFTGPLIVKEYDVDSNKTAKRMVLGYNLSTFFIYQKDPSPAFDGIYRLKPEALDKIRENPLVPSELVGSYVPAANFITEDDIQKYKARSNASSTDAMVDLRLHFAPTPYFNISFDNKYRYIRSRVYSLNNSLLNEDNNPVRTRTNYTGMVTLNHTVKSPYSFDGKSLIDSNDLVSRLAYTIQVDYQNLTTRTMDPHHLDRIFDYGYIGRLQTLRAPVYEYRENQPKTVIDQNGNEVTIDNYHELTGYEDTALIFTPGKVNPLLAGYDKALFSQNFSLTNEQDLVEQGGILNGQNPLNIYSLFNAPGTITSGYTQVQNERFGITAFSEATIHPNRNSKIKHDLQFGLQYEQYFQSYYSLSASSLWRLMPLLVNTHINQVDQNEAILSYDDNGRFTDTLRYASTANLGDQRNFDKNLRNKLIEMGAVDANGNPINQTSIIDINSIDPGILTLDMFSADELLNNGNSYVSYSGYDRLGNRRRGHTSLNDFLNDPMNRPVDSYSPILSSAWIQDKFKIYDIVLRAGLRVERFDANQYVLADPYSLYPVMTVDQAKTSHPNLNYASNISGDHVVYVDNVESPQKITGYRLGNQWFDASGNAINNPEVIATQSSRGAVQPLLVDPQQRQISAASFKEYTPAVNFLPRLAFYFPMNSKSMFFANYDKLAQRPPDAQTFVPLSTYLNFQSYASGVIPNANMKPRVKTDYMVGFTQLIGDFSDISVSANYAEIRNDFNQVRIAQAYPYSYNTYSNIDFSTIKSFKMSYGYHGKHLNLGINYNLQFADGTGSNINSAATLLQSGQPNLRSLYPLSFDTRHNIKGSISYSTSPANREESLKEKSKTGLAKAAKNMLFSMNVQAYSGMPYTSIIKPISEAQASLGTIQRSQVNGNPFGSRMPWRIYSSARIQKSFVTKTRDVGGLDVPTQTLDVFLVADNLFNVRIIENVYSYTGSATDDGYLNSPVGQQQMQNQLSAQTFETLYNIKLQNPLFSYTPRMVQIGFRYNFM